jgi:hypothetical protein
MLDRGVPAKHRFQCAAVNQADDPPQGGWSRCTLHFRWESGLQQRETRLDESTQGLAGLRPAQQTEDAEQKDVGQAIALRLLVAGIGHARQHLYEWVIHWCNLCLAASWQGMVTLKTRFCCLFGRCRIRIHPVLNSVDLVSNDPAFNAKGKRTYYNLAFRWRQPS